MAILLQDLRFALRSLRMSPGFVVVAVLALALGIGANSAMFSLVDAVLLRPMPFADANRLAMIWEEASFVGFPRNTPSPANYIDWKRQNQVFESMAALRFWTFSLTGNGEPERVDARLVSGDFFSVLGVKPEIGRTIQPEDDRPDAPKVAVISYGLWQRRYAGDRTILGQSVLMNDEKHTIVGVMPPRFSFPSKGIDVYAPLSFPPEQWARRGSHFLNVLGRLKPGVSAERAQADMDVVAARLRRDYPKTNEKTGVLVAPLRNEYTRKVRVALMVLLCAVGCVLLIACANVANLLLVRASVKRREIALRLALGAGRSRIIRQLLTENILLSGVAGVLGIVLARVSFTFLSRLIPDNMAGATLQLDYRVVAFTFTVSICTGCLFGLLPALQASRVDLNDALKAGGRSVSGSGKRLRNGLVICEIALAMVLLTCAGLLVQTLVRLRGLDPGFRTEHRLVVTTILSPRGFSKDSERVAFASQVVDRVKALPGVRLAGFASALPLEVKGNTTGFFPEGTGTPLPGRSYDSNYREVTPEYLQTMGVPLVRGRYLERGDSPDSRQVAVINETMARDYWPGRDALGRRFKIGDPNGDTSWIEVVGVVGDIRQMGLEEPPRAEMYLPITQVKGPDPSFLVVQTNGEPLSLAAAVRREIRAVNALQTVSNIRTMEQIVDVEIAHRRLQMLLLGTFAGLALLLASIGIYGVLSYAVTQRTSEIGVRVALGARTSDVLGMVVREGLLLGLAGVGIGLALARLISNLLRSMLFGVSAGDPATFASVGSLLLVIAAIASYIPARRAARVDPLVALRYE